ncbi:MAG TPA: PASTA domain-containing protein, partial [Chloroflexota bacterium]|nr:PASTA domain-containing protein [Chloroflexota bacterium]
PEAAAAGGPTRARAAVAPTGGAAGLRAGEAAPRRVDDWWPRGRQRLRAPRWAVVAVPFVVLLLAAVIALPGLARGRQASVPDLAGHTLQDAQAAVAAAGLQLTTEEQTTLDTSAGVIVTQDPLPGSRPAAGSTVHAVVSAGVSVPDVMGLQCTEARAALGGRGWTVKPVRWRVANVSEFGKVVAQDPAAGSVVKDKGEISVQVAGPVRPC